MAVLGVPQDSELFAEGIDDLCASRSLSLRSKKSGTSVSFAGQQDRRSARLQAVASAGGTV